MGRAEEGSTKTQEKRGDEKRKSVEDEVWE